MREKDALDYHSGGRSGKIEVINTKPCVTQRDLSLAYTPGVAVPCERIRDHPEDAYRYTAKGNLVAVVSNGTAVLGMGNIGPLAGKPVMEGKGVLFKRFADIDVFDLEVNSTDPQEIIRLVKMLEPTFGGINLEDIRAPECFEIEETLRREMSTPVFHDDQHGTAIISGAALLNALTLAEKKIDAVKVVFNGAGSAGIACARYYLQLGVRPENLILCDSSGPVFEGRDVGMNPYQSSLASSTDVRSLEEAMVGADVLVGLSVANCVTRRMVRSMADRPIVLAMANPDPEITYDDARAARPDAIVATGRSDYPNQVNNVLGFPFIFRGALDVQARAINEEMKLAATRALADLAREDVPDSVMKAYGLKRLHFGPDYLIPKPFDYRVLISEAAAVARAAMESGVARLHIDIEEYKEQLESRLGKSREIMRFVIRQARRSPKRIVFAEGEHEKVLRASQVVLDEGFAQPILIGNPETIHCRASELDLSLNDVQIIEPLASALDAYTAGLFGLRCRRGVTMADARMLLRNPTTLGAMMVRNGDADALIAGISQHYPDTLRQVLQVIHPREGVSLTAGLLPLLVRDKLYFFTDPMVNIEPTASELADIAIMSAEEVERFHIEPKVAMISFSNFGSAKHACVDKVRRATEFVKERAPQLIVDGEMQAGTAVTPEILADHYPFSPLQGGANILVFPDLQSANGAYHLVRRLAAAEPIGPILMGLERSVHLLQHGMEVDDVVRAAALSVVDAQDVERNGSSNSSDALGSWALTSPIE